MNKVRLLPVVILAIAALLVLKTIGLVTHGGYVLGVTEAQAAGGGHGAAEPAHAAGEPTLVDTSPTLDDSAPTLGAGQGGHGEAPSAEESTAASPATSPSYCIDADASLVEPSIDPDAPPADDGAPENLVFGTNSNSFAGTMSLDCLPSGDVVPAQLGDGGKLEPLASSDGSSPTEQQILERLGARRGELEQYEQDLALRSSLVDAAEQRIAERQTALEALEAQISTLVDQREAMETGQFAGIVAMYEAMKPRDAANIFNNLEMSVLLRVAKAMAPRKMAPIIAEMQPARAQELTVQMAGLADQPATQMTPDDLSALPQIVGQ